MQKQTKLLLIQGKRIATYIDREQQQVLLSETDVTFQMVKDVFKHNEYWTKNKTN
jgi:hypothetical protein